MKTRARAIHYKIAISLLLMVSSFAPMSLAQNDSARRNVNLEWEPVEGATKYDLKVVRIKDGKKMKPYRFDVSKPLWNGRINPGQYEMQLRSVDDRNVPGEWSEPIEFWVKVEAPVLQSPTERESVLTDENDSYDLKFAWKPVPGAEKYLFELKGIDRPDHQTKFETDKASTLVELDVAEAYQWRVSAIMPEGEIGEIPEIFSSFTLVGAQIEKPSIEEPADQFVETIEIEKPDYADTLAYAIFQKTDDKQWKLVEQNKKHTSPEIPFDLSRPSGKYKLVVQALGRNRKTSKASSLEFPVRGGFRSPAAIEDAKLQYSIEKPSNFYAIASYFITSVNYFGFLREAGAPAEFSAVGGVGRLGLGFQKPNETWGVFGVADAGGFNISGENYIFTSAEIHGTYRWVYGRNVLLLGSGLFYKELPVIEGNTFLGLTGVGQVASLGPHVGFKYWRPISYRLGFQLNARIYYNMQAVSTPSDTEGSPDISYQAGLLGSLKLSKRLMGFAGYAYKIDRASFGADRNAPSGFAENGGTNEVQLQGHYLNLILEYSF